VIGHLSNVAHLVPSRQSCCRAGKTFAAASAEFVRGYASAASCAPSLSAGRLLYAVQRRDEVTGHDVQPTVGVGRRRPGGRPRGEAPAEGEGARLLCYYRTHVR